MYNDDNQNELNNAFIMPSMIEDNNDNNIDANTDIQSDYQAPIYQEPIQNDMNNVIDESVNNVDANISNENTFIQEPINDNYNQSNVGIEEPVEQSTINSDVVYNNDYYNTESIETTNSTFESVDEINNNNFDQEFVQPSKSFLPDFDVSSSDRKDISYSDESVKPQSTINNLMSNNSTNMYQSAPKVYAVEKQKNSLPVVILITGIVLVIGGYLAYTFMNTMSRKMVCESNNGSITITYNNSGIIGYKSDKISYDIYEQRTYADEVGIKQYLNEFATWFNTNTNGQCKK